MWQTRSYDRACDEQNGQKTETRVWSEKRARKTMPEQRKITIDGDMIV